MSILAWIEDQKRLKLLNAPKYVHPAADSSKGLWTRCDKCGVILYIKHLKENQRVCFGCSYHLQMSSQERVENLLDRDSWRPLDETVSPCDPLEFHDQKNYTDRLQEAQERTGLQDAIQTGSGMVDGIPVAFGVMDFDFMGGSMGSVVGEKVTRLIEYATQEGLTLILVCASGGARMQEGVFSLMQMAKISSALQVYQTCANLLYISILTSPTTGGVTASFAMLGDIIFAEPKALIAFAGRRVIEQTLCEDLPEDFQTSEYMLHHGLLDLIVPRRFLRQALSESIRLYKNAPFKKPGRIPFGVQNPITFLAEERIRRRWSEGNVYIAKDSPHQSLISSNQKQGKFSSLEEKETPSAPRNGKDAVGMQATSRDAILGKDVDKSTPIQSRLQKDYMRTKAHEGSSKSEFKQTNSTKPFRGLTQMVNPPLERNNAGYRDILTSFQTMFHLFSKQLALPYSVRANATNFNLRQMDNSTKELNSENQNKDDFLLQSFIKLSENQSPVEISTQKASNLSVENTLNGTKQSEFKEKIKEKGEVESNPLLSPISQKFVQTLDKNSELMDSSDFLNKSIELAATECVEWRAFYVHQRISQTTGFLEDFVRSFSEQSDNYENTLQNTLFYRSICQKIH